MKKKQRPFTEKEDQIIIQCLKEATGPNMSDVMRKASTITGRSFQSCYQRWITMGKPTPKSLDEETQNFNNWKLLHNFYYGDTEYIKGWINSRNYYDIWKNNWEALMELVEKIEKCGEYCVSIHTNWTNISLREFKNFKTIIDIEDNTKILNTYYACIGFIKWYNKNKKNAK